ncbi:hypothetical protein ACIQLJ_08415 [Microbacterium sp. NPDC091313]
MARTTSGEGERMRGRGGARWRTEAAGWVAAAAISLGVAGIVASVSSNLLFTDGDSLIVAMVVRSMALGQAQDWAMSPVLFLPEIAVYALLSLLGLGLRATIVLNAVVNLLALYGALRIVAGRARPGRAPITGSLVAFGLAGVLALLEGSAQRDGAQFMTLFLTTTYYSATVIAVLLAVGICRRVLEGARAVPAAAVLAVVAAVSVLSNPLFAVWAVLPVGAVLAILVVVRRIAWRPAAWLVGALVVGSGVGYLGRGAFAGTIVAQSDNYFRIGQFDRSAAAYGQALDAMASTWHGALWVAVVVVLWVVAGAGAALAWRRRDAGLLAVTGVATLGPLIVTAGAFALGTDAIRYLQPWLFLPLGAAAALLAVVFVPTRRGVRRVLAGGAAVVVVGSVVVGAPSAVSAASAVNRDLSCVDTWVQDSGRTGAGQFWTVRAPKANLADPTRLIQVDHTLRVYTWLTNRTDAEGAQVTFLVQDAQSPAFQLPDGLTTADATAVACGRYTIYDFGDRVLPLGPPRN